jgi:hypothetical protein
VVEAAVPTLVYDPGIKGLSWIGNVLVSIGQRIDTAKSIIGGKLIGGHASRRGLSIRRIWDPGISNDKKFNYILC